MKYIYYIIGILILITIGFSFRLSGLKVEVSEPAIIINDRIISKSELGERAKFGSYHSRGKGFLNSVITRELLIQEAIKQGIHKEEAFRKSVETFYEQSLIKVLVDRKYQSLSPAVTKDMIGKFKEMLSKTIRYTKFVYENEVDVQNGKVKSTETLENDFINLSESLKFSLFLLTPGASSKPEFSEEGYVVYRLDNVSVSSKANNIPNDSQVRAFLSDQRKRAQFDLWMNETKEKADIQILTHEKVSEEGQI
ncbi:MAG: hypothetical protein RBT11_08375 [Desulfobacterales bacterium]|jgi:hypothetical protein|nr:hypothetical protein [Desulfobacterales bacterium]